MKAVVNFVNLGDDVYAMRFKYHMVTERTLPHALPAGFERSLMNRGEYIQFAEESEKEAGTKRANAEIIRKAFPAEIAILSGIVGNLADFVIIKTAARSK